MAEEGLSIAAYTLLLVSHVVMLYLVQQMYKNRMHPAVSIRRFNLIAISEIYYLIYDLTWSIDGIYTIYANSSLSCGFWEMFDSLQALSVAIVFLIRSWVLLASVKRVRLMRELRTADSETKNEVVLESLKNELVKLQKLTSASAIVGIVSIITLVYLVLLIINWSLVPELILRNFEYYDEQFGCYQSWSFRVIYYSMFPVAALCLVFLSKTPIKVDEYKIKQEISVVIILWTLHWIIFQALNYSAGYDEILNVFLWIALKLFIVLFSFVIPLRAINDSKTIAKEAENESERMRNLQEIFQDSLASEDFRKFLDKEFALEFLLFLDKVKEFETLTMLCKNITAGLDVGKLIDSESTAKEIVAMFLTRGAALELNIIPEIKDKYVSLVSKKGFVAPGDFFDEVKLYVMLELSSYTLLRFLLTDAGKKFRERINEKQNEKLALLAIGDQSSVSIDVSNVIPMGAVPKV